MTKLTPSSWVKIALIALLCLVLCAGMAGCFAAVQRWVSAAVGNFAHHYGAIAAGSDYDNYGNAEVPADSVRRISIDWLAGEVEVSALDDDACNGMIQMQETFSIDGFIPDSERMVWELNDAGELSIASMRGELLASNVGLSGCSHHAAKRLSVAIPVSRAHELEELRIGGASGKYNLLNIGADELDIDLASGKMDGSALSAEKLNLSVASGHIALEGSFTEHVSLDMASGNVALTCTDECPKTAAFDVMSGSAHLLTPANSGYSVTVDRVSGAFTCPRAQMQGDAYVVGNGASRFTVDMASGNVTID